MLSWPDFEYRLIIPCFWNDDLFRKQEAWPVSANPTKVSAQPLLGTRWLLKGGVWTVVVDDSKVVKDVFPGQPMRNAVIQ